MGKPTPGDGNALYLGKRAGHCIRDGENSYLVKSVVVRGRLHSDPRLMIDNQAVIHLIGNPQASRHSEHISIRHYFVRERAQEGDFTVEHCASEQNSADLFTKILPKSTFQRLRTSAGLLSPEDDQRTHRSVNRDQRWILLHIQIRLHTCLSIGKPTVLDFRTRPTLLSM